MPQSASAAPSVRGSVVAPNAPTKMNLTYFKTDACADTDVVKVQQYDLTKCKKATIALCDMPAGQPGNATLVWYDDTDKKCAGAINSTKS